jgi:hypothetical protein
MDNYTILIPLDLFPLKPQPEETGITCITGDKKEPIIPA